MHSLPVFLRLTGRPVILLGAGEAADAKRRLLDRAGARIVGEEEAAALAIVAIDEEREARAAVERLRARGILINAVDRPLLCDFTLPAFVDRDPVLVAIGTGGMSAGLAKALRQRFEALLPSALGRLADNLHRARPAIRARFPDATDRRRAIDAALDPGGALDPFGEAGNVEDWLSDADATVAQTVHLMVRSADPDDLTLAEARWLARADTVYYDPEVPAAILARIRADARLVPSREPEPQASGMTVILRTSG